MGSRKSIDSARRSHGAKRISPETRSAIQQSPLSAAQAAQQFGVNKKTVLRWRKRDNSSNAPPGPSKGSRRLSREDEILIVNFRISQRLPLDDCLFALQAYLPSLTRWSLHNCLKRHGINRLPVDTIEADQMLACDRPRLGMGIISTQILPTRMGQFRQFGITDLRSRFALGLAYPVERMDAADDFMRVAKIAFPFPIHSVVAALDIADPAPPAHYDASDLIEPFWELSRQHNIQYILRPWYHPWSAAQAAALSQQPNRLEDQSLHFERIAESLSDIGRFTAHENFGSRLKTLRAKSPFAFAMRETAIDIAAYRDRVLDERRLIDWWDAVRDL